MSKKYKDKICAYCATKKSSTADHVIAREFFPKSHRGTYPKVPSCTECNNRKSRLEQYATTLFLFGSRHVSAMDELETKAPKRLAKNLKLHRELQNKKERIWLKSESGLIVPSMTLPVNAKNLEKLFSMIVRGLYWHHWETNLPSDYFVDIYNFSLEGFIFFHDKVLSVSPVNFIKNDFGDGVFRYGCTRGDEDPFISAWEMHFYDRIMIAGGNNEQLFFCALTGPEEIRESISLHSVS